MIDQALRKLALVIVDRGRSVGMKALPRGHDRQASGVSPLGTRPRPVRLCPGVRPLSGPFLVRCWLTKRSDGAGMGPIRTATPVINGANWWYSVPLSEFGPPFLNGGAAIC